MATKPTSSDIYDINKKTGALILGKNRLEDYATKYLTKHCKEALERPMPLPVEKILEDEKLEVREVSLSRELDIVGCCMLLTGQVNIYDEESDSYHPECFPEGTILFDPKLEALYGEGAKRNTLIHEALHWEKDKKYFEILQLKNRNASDKLYPILCRSSKTFYEPPEGKKTKENEVKWLEWQAHRLAPRVLMPYNMFKKKAFEYIAECRDDNNGVEASCDLLIEKLSDFFIVSRESVKYRLDEVGLLDEISDFEDFEIVYAQIRASEEYVKLTPFEAFDLLLEDSLLQEWVSGGRFIYVDGYFVLADKKYITIKDGRPQLTAKAKRNIEKCALNIRVQNYTEYKNFHKDYLGYTMMFAAVGVDRRLYSFHPKYQPNLDIDPDELYEAAKESIIDDYDDEEEIELVRMLRDPTTTLCQCLWYLIKRKHWITPEKFYQETLINKNYHGRIKNDKANNMETGVLMAICVGLRLSLEMTEEVFDKSKNKLDRFHAPDKVYMRILANMPGLSIDDFNGILKHAGLDELGSKIRDND